MMSLFSSFDLTIFYLPTYFSVIVLLLGLKSFWSSHSSLYFIYSELNLFISKFLYTLNLSNYSKSLDYLFFSFFICILSLNLMSIFPFIFPFTSQVSTVLSLSLLFWLSMSLFSLIKNFKSFLSHLVPESAPIFLSPFLFLIELVSLIIRPITLSVRLIANILAGHLLIILLSNFIMYYNYLFFFLSFLSLVELFVSLIQSYIFVTLVSLYYSEV